jgi:chaperonin GroES
MTDYGANMLEPACTVAHASLTPWSPDSAYRARCPVCPTGILMVYRNQVTLALQRLDRCIRCGQAFTYTDETIAGEPFESDQRPAKETRTMKLKPLQDRIVIKRLEADDKSAGGLYIPENAKEKPARGEVLAVGAGRYLDNGERAPMPCAVGDMVIFGKYQGNEITLEGEQYLIVSADDVLGVIEAS